MKKPLVLSALAIALLLPGAASASSMQLTTVVKVEVAAGSSVGVVTLSGAKTAAAPGCAFIGFPRSYAFDLSTAKGKGIFALAQAAVLSGKKVDIQGSATCITGSGTTTSVSTSNSGYEILSALTIYF